MQGWPDQPEMEQDVIIADGEAASAAGKPIDNVIFDFGNVLVYWHPEDALISRYSQQTIDEFLDNEQSGFYDVCNLTDGGASIEEAVAWAREHHGERWAEVFRYYFENFQDSLAGVVPGARKLVADLKQAGVGVWGLSNWSGELFPAAYDQFRILHMLDGKVISGPIGMRKPHADIFEHALHEFGITADTALFVDDKSENVAGGNAVGIRGVQFTSPTALRQLLIDAGVNIPAAQQ
ncbi:HAD family hydrolase [Bifidobacterium simiarum]|uniref:HAD family hydrolase n=1 Tax=Bifidobacterium simiarum TaxID=2045441 RepID=UPI001BDCE2F9|nr:HAD family phosphatase [Bifidobacterium simiarum]MBT1165883.1 HAD family phosphatase [Bifidobacterium simiarum]